MSSLETGALEAPAPKSAPLKEVVERATTRIAPTWPLDRFIAVNPLWSWTDRPLPLVAGELAALAGARLLPPRAWYEEMRREGRLDEGSLRAAGARRRVPLDASAPLPTDAEVRDVAPRARVVDVMDARRPATAGTSWRELMVDSISQFCATYFDEGQADFATLREGGLYAAWRRSAVRDRAPAVKMGLSDFAARARTLPESAVEAIAVGLSELAVPPDERERYLVMLLLDVNGWASYCAYLRWVARLAGGDDTRIVELLAIRIAWECILHESGGREVQAAWRRAQAAWTTTDRAARAARADDWVLQDAVELAWQTELARRLEDGLDAPRPKGASVQAVFCIDVRSEVFRRALESSDRTIQTLGFAGFFGMPIEHAPLGTEAHRPQLPGLLAPKYRTTEVGADADRAPRRRAHLHTEHAWDAFKSSPLSGFAFVESVGALAGGSLLRNLFPRRASKGGAGLREDEHHTHAPHITHRVDGTPITNDERVALAAGMLRAMGLTRDFAPVVLLVGHGSRTTNNPHRAGLDCGACCGQTGEVNARAAAALLADAEVRTGLRARGIDVPDGTIFVAGLHETTTDDVILFDEDAPASAAHREALATLRATLAQAGVRARRHRAPRLGLGELSDEEITDAVTARAGDWAEVRPEWGLAGNAAFVVAPRERTRHADLEGRCFLHDYRYEEDPGFAILEQIMTAPMLVTHWINFQYYTSSVDNARYGSGNKVLHNVVGGHLGVFEGNGGDLRIGLPMQSLHDGQRLVHEPLRLTVLIEAPATAIDAILEKHPKVGALVENEWLHLVQIDPPSSSFWVRRRGGWDRLPG